MNWLQLLFIIFALTFSGYAQSGSLRANRLKLKIVDLRPTQGAVGFREVKRKKEKIKNFKTRKELDEYFEKNSVPVVLGPDGQVYMIDHHHFALAAFQAGHEHVYAHVVADFSELNSIDFWNQMKAKEWVYLKENGKIINEYQLPIDIRRLKDDPYRSLAGNVRQKDGYKKTEIPFAEFQWADFFRDRISIDLLEKNYDKAVALAISLAKTDEAKRLPGYKGNALCFEVYAN